MTDKEIALGDVVYLRVRKDKLKGMVTKVSHCLDGGTYYEVRWGDCSETAHYAAELSSSYIPDFVQDD